MRAVCGWRVTLMPRAQQGTMATLDFGFDTTSELGNAVACLPHHLAWEPRPPWRRCPIPGTQAQRKERRSTAILSPPFCALFL